MSYDGNIEATFERLKTAIRARDEQAALEAALDVGRCVVECLARIAAAVETINSPPNRDNLV